MSRPFSTAAQRLYKWLGYSREQLPENFKNAVERYAENGAQKKVGSIDSIEILHRNDGSSPVHQSFFNKRDKAWIVSARITPANGERARTHHIYSDGTGTFRVGDKREFSMQASSD